MEGKQNEAKAGRGESRNVRWCHCKVRQGELPGCVLGGECGGCRVREVEGERRESEQEKRVGRERASRQRSLQKRAHFQRRTKNRRMSRKRSISCYQDYSLKSTS